MAALFAPTELNIKDGLVKLLSFMGCVFVMAGVQGALLFLAKRPVPEMIENGDTQHFTKETIKE
jgi:hypothetical protein